jgi:RNA polymerase sigma-70 factor (ECF subfamily)
MREGERLDFTTRLDLEEEARLDEDSARLVVEAQRGDSSALATLYERYFEAIYAYLRVALKDRHEAEDRAQQVFTKALEALPKYKPRPNTPFRAWLFRVARNEVISYQRKHNVVEVEPPEVIDRRREGQAPEPDALSLAAFSDGDLVFLIERLSEAQRQVLALRYMIGLTTEEIAAVLNKTPQAIGQLHYRARCFLEERLGAIRARRDRLPSEAIMAPARRHQSERYLYTVELKFTGEAESRYRSLSSDTRITRGEAIAAGVENLPYDEVPGLEELEVADLYAIDFAG